MKKWKQWWSLHQSSGNNRASLWPSLLHGAPWQRLRKALGSISREAEWPSLPWFTVCQIGWCDAIGATAIETFCLQLLSCLKDSYFTQGTWDRGITLRGDPMVKKDIFPCRELGLAPAGGAKAPFLWAGTFSWEDPQSFSQRWVAIYSPCRTCNVFYFCPSPGGTLAPMQIDL